MILAELFFVFKYEDLIAALVLCVHNIPFLQAVRLCKRCVATCVRMFVYYACRIQCL